MQESRDIAAMLETCMVYYQTVQANQEEDNPEAGANLFCEMAETYTKAGLINEAVAILEKGYETCPTYPVRQ